MGRPYLWHASDLWWRTNVVHPFVERRPHVSLLRAHGSTYRLILKYYF
jgi:hypothetical protein